MKDEGGAARDYMERGRAHLEAGRLNEAVAELSRAASLDPKLSQAHSLLAVAYDRKGLRDRAADSYRRAIDVNDRDPAGAQQPRLLALPQRQLPRGGRQAEARGETRARRRAHPEQPRAGADAARQIRRRLPQLRARGRRVQRPRERRGAAHPRGARGEGRRAPRSRAPHPARLAERAAPARRSSTSAPATPTRPPTRARRSPPWTRARPLAAAEER